jgi:hypothetical protein
MLLYLLQTKPGAAGKTVKQFLLDWGADLATGLNIRLARVTPTDAGLSLFGFDKRRSIKAPPWALAKLLPAVSQSFYPACTRLVLQAQELLRMGEMGDCWRGIIGGRNCTGGIMVAIKLARGNNTEDALHYEVAVYTYLQPFAKGVRHHTMHFLWMKSE